MLSTELELVKKYPNRYFYVKNIGKMRNKKNTEVM